jgi:hypothetical protein
MTPEQQLRELALRVTRPRVAMLAEVNAHPTDVDTLTAKVRSRLGSVSTQAVDDVLRVLADAELIRRIQPAGSPARFQARVGDNHHHVVRRQVRRPRRHRPRHRLASLPGGEQHQRFYNRGSRSDFPGSVPRLPAEHPQRPLRGSA